MPSDLEQGRLSDTRMALSMVLTRLASVSTRRVMMEEGRLFSHQPG